MKSLEERKIELAILKVQQEIMRKFVTSKEYRDFTMKMAQEDEEGLAVHQFFYELAEKADNFEKTQFDDLPSIVSLSGFCEGSVSHYDIDKALEKKFGNDVFTDSESGQFHADCYEPVLEEVSKFLENKYPDLSFNSRKKDGNKKIFERTRDAEEFLKEKGIEAPHPLKEMGEILEAIKKEREEFEKKIQDLSESMLVVGGIEAQAQMEKVDDKIKNKIVEFFLESIENDYKDSIKTAEAKETEKEVENYKRNAEHNLKEAKERLKGYKRQHWFSLRRMTGMLCYGLNMQAQKEFRKKIILEFGKDLTSFY